MVWVVSLLSMKLSPHRLTPVHRTNGIRSLIGVGKLVGPLTHSVLYLRQTNTRLYQNIFRGEPAITKFDWSFTPKHSSSPNFSTLVGSDLQRILLRLHPGHA
jgi:hypothetical protein